VQNATGQFASTDDTLPTARRPTQSTALGRIPSIVLWGTISNKLQDVLPVCRHNP
jgi:hypothetical protein